MKTAWTSLTILGLLSLAACTPPADTGLPDADGDGYSEPDDCDDGDAAVHPDAAEVCNQQDDDCDDQVDEYAGDRWYQDADGDGYGDASSTLVACEQPTGWVADGTDCDDADPDVHPDAPEVCDDEDDDCDDQIDDDPTGAPTWYADRDGDGYGDPGQAVTACEQPSGTVDVAGDCDDDDDRIHPEAPEVCDEQDNDCDDQTDEDALDAATWYQDDDGDGWGLDASTTLACDQPSGFAADPGDCADGDAEIHPQAAEYCDSVDTDCDGDPAPDDALDAETWHPDADGDGWGDAASGVVQCFATGDLTADGSDCDDADPQVNPDADEVCDGADNDCDGLTDDPSALDAATWYADADADGWGDPATTTVACADPGGWAQVGGDCDESDGAINPGAVELCGDGTDGDCADGDPACPAAGDLLITEIMKDPAVMSDADGEWIEIANVSASTFDLEGLVVYDLDGDDWQIDASLSLAPGAFAILARSALATAAYDVAWSGFQLANDEDEVILATWGTDGTDGDVIHGVVYNDAAGWPDTAGASMSLDPDAWDVASAADPANWCDATSPFDTGDLGTPGAVNDPCE